MKMQYVSPSVHFENLFLLEKVADTCWGYVSQYKEKDRTIYTYFNYDDPSVVDDECVLKLSGSNCGGAKIENWGSLTAKQQASIVSAGNSGEPYAHTSFLRAASS